MYENPTHCPTAVGAVPKSAAATGASTAGTASAIAVSDCTARVSATAATTPAAPGPSPPFKIGDAARAPFVEDSLRTALELVAKSHRVFAGVGPNEAMIGRF